MCVFAVIPYYVVHCRHVHDDDGAGDADVFTVVLVHPMRRASSLVSYIPVRSSTDQGRRSV